MFLSVNSCFVNLDDTLVNTITTIDTAAFTIDYGAPPEAIGGFAEIDFFEFFFGKVLKDGIGPCKATIITF